MEKFWKDLEPIKSKNLLKSIPKLDVQFIDKEGLCGIEGMVIKIKEFEEEQKSDNGCVLVNYVHADFGEDRLLSWEDKTKIPPPCPTGNYSIKNKVALLCEVDKKDYFERMEKWYHHYLNGRILLAGIFTGGKGSDKKEEWIRSIWNNLAPHKNIIKELPILDVHYMQLDEEGYEFIEIKGKINFRWDRPSIFDYEVPGWLLAKMEPKRKD